MEYSKHVIAERPDGSVVEGWKPRGGAEAFSRQKWEPLAWFLDLASRPEPEDEAAWRQLADDIFWTYVHGLSGLPLAVGNRVEQARDLFQRLRALWAELESEQSFAVPIEWGAQRFRVKEGRLVPSYGARDPTSAFLLAFVEQLTALDDLSKIQRCATCGTLFYKVKRQVYCSKACKEKARVPSLSRDRTKVYRERRRAWNRARATLERALGSMRTLYQTTECQALEKAEQAFEKAQRKFDNAFRHKNGQEYEDGKAFLARASEQIKRLRKKVKGY